MIGPAPIDAIERSEASHSAGAGIIGRLIFQYSLGFIVGALIVYFYPPGKGSWIVILSLLVVLFLLAIANEVQKGTGIEISVEQP